MNYSSLAFDRLTFPGEAREVDNGIVEFMGTLCWIEDELLEFEAEVSRIEIDPTGWRASQELGTTEGRHSDYLDEINDAHEAILRGHLTHLDRNPGEKHRAGRTQEEVPQYRDDLKAMVRRLEDISDRVGRRIDSKRNSANTRLVFTVAALAAILSVFTLLGQIIGLIAQAIGP